LKRSCLRKESYVEEKRELQGGLAPDTSQIPFVGRKYHMSIEKKKIKEVREGKQLTIRGVLKEWNT